jgi:hypothetical protein
VSRLKNILGNFKSEPFSSIIIEKIKLRTFSHPGIFSE